MTSAARLERNLTRMDSQIRELRRAVGAAASPLHDDLVPVYTALHARADAAYRAVGMGSAPGPYGGGESVNQYRRRPLKPLQRYSPDWKNIDLLQFRSDALKIAERDILADAERAAPTAGPRGKLRQHVTVDEYSGVRKIIWRGDEAGFINQFRAHPRQAKAK
jgi:hypothetical protein